MIERAGHSVESLAVGMVTRAEIGGFAARVRAPGQVLNAICSPRDRHERVIVVQVKGHARTDHCEFASRIQTEKENAGFAVDRDVRSDVQLRKIRNSAERRQPARAQPALQRLQQLRGKLTP